MKIILGSSSSRRKEVLQEMGYEFEVVSPDIDEKRIKRNNPSEQVLAVAEAKMKAVLGRVYEPAIVIVADSIVEAEGSVREKPVDKKEAYEFINKFENVPQTVITGVVVANTLTGDQISAVDKVKLIFGQIPKDNIINFVESGEALNYAGGLAFQHPLFLPHINEYDGEEESIKGLPRKITQEMIEELAK